MSQDLKDIKETSLTEEQSKILNSLYDIVKESVNSLITSKDMNDNIIITLTLANVIKNVEKTALKGADKKIVALELTKKIICDILPERKDAILLVFSLTSESILETLVDVSKTVNVTITNATEELKENIKETINKPKACCTIM